MLTHKCIAVTSLVVIIVLASLMLIPSVKATIIAEMPPYEDKWTLTGGSNYPYADADLSTGRLAVFMFPFTTEDSSAHVKTWKRVWLPATDLEITYSWKIKGYLMCGLFLSWTGIHLYLFVEESLNSGTISETTLFHKYVDMVFEYQESIDEPWQSDSKVVSIPEAGYYNIGAGLAGLAGGLIASCVFGGEEDQGAWVSMSIGTPGPCTLSISASYGGTTDPAVGTYTFDYGESVTVTAEPDYTHFDFDCWLLDDVEVDDNPITVTMDSDHTLKACFDPRGGGSGCPTLFVWSGTHYAEEGFLNIHAETDITVQHEIQNLLALENDVYKLQLRELDNYTSHIDQVKLYAVDYEGEWHLCPLTYAYHNTLGKVKQTLRFDDNNRLDLEPTQLIDLKFAQSISYGETEYFTFEINGYNQKTPIL